MATVCRCRWYHVWVWTATSLCMLLCCDTSSAIILSDVGRQYEGAVTEERPVTYSFTWHGKGNRYPSMRPVRLTLSTNATNSSLSTSVKGAREAGIAAWDLPVAFKGTPQLYNSTSHTVCMSRNDAAAHVVLVNVLTTSELPVAYTIVAHTVDDFVLKAGSENQQGSVVSPTSSVYYRYDFEPGQHIVTVLVESTDAECGMVSVQKAECPVLDQVDTIHTAGSYQSFTGLSAIVVRRDAAGDSFHVVVVGLINKELCSKSSVRLIRVDQSEVSGYDYKKNITIQVLPQMQDYALPVGMCLAVFLTTYLLVFLHLCVQYYQKRRTMSLLSYVFVMSHSIGKSAQAASASKSSAKLTAPRAETVDTLPGVKPGVDASLQDQASMWCSNKEILDSTLDLLKVTSELEYVKDCFTPPICSKAEYSVPRAAKCCTTSSQASYASVLSAVAVFFSLPAFQVLYNYQNILNNVGSQDLCHFNFRCLRPLGPLISFNNMFSNTGYCLLGILLILQTYRYQRTRRYKANGDTTQGLQEDYGVYYAIGCTLFSEGFWSAGYHGCPNASTVLLDVSFIYLMIIFIVLALYRKRHPDAGNTPHQVFLFVGVLVIMALVGQLHDSLALWVVVGILYMTLTTVVSGYLYHNSWLGTVTVLKNVYSTCRSGEWRSLQLDSRRRFTVAVAFQVWNFLVAINAMYNWKSPTQDLVFMFVTVFGSNAIGYLIYYLTMKMIGKEGLRPLSISLALVTFAVVGVAFLSYFTAETNYLLTPSKSRMLNQDCYVLGFFSLHDMWHLCSAYLVYVVALLVLTADDNLKTTPTSDIEVW